MADLFIVEYHHGDCILNNCGPTYVGGTVSLEENVDHVEVVENEEKGNICSSNPTFHEKEQVIPPEATEQTVENTYCAATEQTVDDTYCAATEPVRHVPVPNVMESAPNATEPIVEPH